MKEESQPYLVSSTLLSTLLSPLVMDTLPTATCCSADAAPSNVAQSCADKQAETVITPAIISNGISSSNEESVLLVPPEAVVPKECLPDVLDVYDEDTLRSVIHDKWVSSAEWRSWEKFLARTPVKYVRECPASIRTKGEEAAGDVSKASESATLDRRTTGKLDLRRPRRLGSSNHSSVFLAPFTPSCAAPSLCVKVAVKLAKTRSEDHEMLRNEAYIYDEFPCELQEITPSLPPIVPKFFGYYYPSCETVGSYEGDDGDEEGALTVQRDVNRLIHLDIISPILLLEPCGEPIKASSLSESSRETIVGVFERLHNARFVQKSVYERNILVQPGPLTCPVAERSFNNPSYRLIDFGRGKSYTDRKESVSADDDMTDELERARLLTRDGLYWYRKIEAPFKFN